LKIDSFFREPSYYVQKKTPLNYLKDFEMEPDACQDMEESAHCHEWISGDNF